MKSLSKKLFNIAVMLVVAYVFVLFSATVDAKVKKKSKKHRVVTDSVTATCTPKIASITQSWSQTDTADDIVISWSCSGMNNVDCNIYVVAHVYKDGSPFPPDDPINHKINNIWTDGDGLSCGYGKTTTLFVFLGNIPPGNYSCEVDIYNGTVDYHSLDPITTNTYNWVIQ